jgi:hypothetical protein
MVTQGFTIVVDAAPDFARITEVSTAQEAVRDQRSIMAVF